MLNQVEKVIFISGAWPDNSKGYSIANLATLDYFSNHVKHGIYFGPDEEKPDPNITGKYVNTAFVPVGFRRKPKSVRFLKSLFSMYPAVTERFWNASSDIEKEIKRRCKTSTEKILFFYEDLPSAYLIFRLKRLYPSSVHMVRSHNVVYKGFKGLTRSGNRFMKLLWRIEVKKIYEYERKVFQTADQFFAISKDDAEYYLKFMAIEPDGIVGFFLDFQPFDDISEPDHNIIYFGSADLRKGQALKQFIKKSWPAIRDACPEVQLFLGGRGTEQFTEPSNRITGFGFIESESDFLKLGSVFINPQVSGAGIKIKSIIALASSKLLVATTIGVEGTGLINGIHCIIEDDFEKQAEIIIRCIKGEYDFEKIVENGKSFVKEQFSRDNFYIGMNQLFHP